MCLRIFFVLICSPGGFLSYILSHYVLSDHMANPSVDPDTTSGFSSISEVSPEPEPSDVQIKV